jgi:hypothetical protein
LKQVGRELLGRLFGRFSGELAKKNVTLPAAELDAWFWVSPEAARGARANGEQGKRIRSRDC